MMIHHSCPRCQGTLITEQDEFACLQCGARVYALANAGPAAETKRESPPTAARAA